MTQSQNPDGRDRQVAREFRDLNRRVDRLEYTQVSPQEFRQAFERVYEEIDDLHDAVGELRTEMTGRFDSLEAKFDTIMRHITGQGNS